MSSVDDDGLSDWDITDDLYDGYSRGSDDVEYEGVECIRATLKAVLIRLEGSQAERWLPKKGLRPSSDVKDVGDTGTLRIHTWAAKMWGEESALVRETKAVKEQVSIEGVVALQGTSKAVLISLADGREIWVPRSHILESSEVKEDPDSGTLTITRWMAEQKGLA
jgi:hypothetical protein